jgi:hypothetical protein
MGPVSENRPFPGAARVYRRASMVLEWMGRNGHVRPVKTRKGRVIQVEASPEMRAIIDAMDRADEETLKAVLLDPRYFPHWQ